MLSVLAVVVCLLLLALLVLLIFLYLLLLLVLIFHIFLLLLQHLFHLCLLKLPDILPRPPISLHLDFLVTMTAKERTTTSYHKGFMLS